MEIRMDWGAMRAFSGCADLMPLWKIYDFHRAIVAPNVKGDEFKEINHFAVWLGQRRGGVRNDPPKPYTCAEGTDTGTLPVTAPPAWATLVGAAKL
jgi:hypothetical protein